MFAGALAVALLCFLVPNHRYFVDGLMTAIKMRDSGGDWIIHPHHILHPLLPQIVYRMVGEHNSGITELELLLIWSMCVGVLACWGQMMVFRAGSFGPFATLMGLGLFSFSRAIWYFSVTPNQNSTALALHVFTLLAIVIALRRLPEGPSRANIVAIGVLTSLAILASQINAVLLLPAVYVMFAGEGISKGRKLGNLARYLGIVALVAGGLFVLTGIILEGVRTPAHFLDWQHSYVYERRWWAQGLVDAIQRTWVGSINVLLASVFDRSGLFGNWREGFGTSHWFLQLTLRVGQAIVLAFFVVETVRAAITWVRTRPLPPIQTIGVLSALPVMIFSCFWAPESSNYRILYIPGFLLFLMPSLVRRYSLDRFAPKRAWPIVIVVLSLFAVNFVTQFLPQATPRNNPYNYEAFALMSFVEPGSLIIYSGTDEGHMRGLYAQYFLRCHTIMVHELVRLVRECPEEVQEGFRDYREAGSLMLVHQDALYSDEDVEWMNAVYGMDIRPGELLEYMNTWTTLGSPLLLINEKRYYPFLPRDGN